MLKIPNRIRISAESQDGSDQVDSSGQLSGVLDQRQWTKYQFSGSRIGQRYRLRFRRRYEDLGRIGIRADFHGPALNAANTPPRRRARSDERFAPCSDIASDLNLTAIPRHKIRARAADPDSKRRISILYCRLPRTLAAPAAQAPLPAQVPEAVRGEDLAVVAAVLKPSAHPAAGLSSSIPMRRAILSNS
jgi:hypothetical protein